METIKQIKKSISREWKAMSDMEREEREMIWNDDSEQISLFQKETKLETLKEVVRMINKNLKSSVLLSVERTLLEKLKLRIEGSS